jgi:F-type H+-transporting ATPase subunit delta
VPLVDAALLEAVDPVLEEAAAGGNAGAVADELPELARLTAAEPKLRGILSDVFVDPDAKKSFLRDVLGSQVHGETLAVVGAIVDRPRLARNVARALEGAAMAAITVSAEADGVLGEVEDEIFRFGRMLRGQSELGYALTDITAPSERKHQLVDELLGDRATSQTVKLVKLLVDTPRQGNLSARLFDLAELAASRRGRVMAEVRTAVELDEVRRDKLAEALAEATGKNVDVKLIVDESILGGVVARVGDEVIDGSVRRNLEQALYRMTRS